MTHFNISIVVTKLLTPSPYVRDVIYDLLVSPQMNENGNFENLPELHSLTCGLKALATQDSADAIDVVRCQSYHHFKMFQKARPFKN